MKRKYYASLTHDQWLTMREQDVTSTQVSALFNCSPYLSEWELYQLKRGLLDDSFVDNDRIKWGRRLEEAIAYGIAEDLGLLVEPFKSYVRLPEHRIGSSFDFIVTGIADDYDGNENYRNLFKEHGKGLMEIKNVDGLVFRNDWTEHEDGRIEAPPHIELQMQHQMLVSGITWAIGAPLIGGNTPKPFYRQYDPEIGNAINVVVAEFWEMLDQGYEPQPDFHRDAQSVIAMHRETNDKKVDMSDDGLLAELCYEYEQASQDELDALKRKEAARAEILTIIGKNKEVTTEAHRIVTSAVKDAPPRVITQDMVGKEIGGREGHRRFAINRRLL